MKVIVGTVTEVEAGMVLACHATAAHPQAQNKTASLTVRMLALIVINSSEVCSSSVAGCGLAFYCSGGVQMAYGNGQGISRIGRIWWRLQLE